MGMRLTFFARKLGISRPLLHLHLQKLQDAGLVTSQLELSRRMARALNYFASRMEVVDGKPTKFRSA